MSLQRKLEALPEHLHAQTRSDALLAMLQAVENAAASGQAAKALHAPGFAPAFCLPDERGRTVCLSDALGEGPVVLVFYRGDWSPACTQELEAMQAVVHEFRRMGASMLAVSPQAAIFNRACVRRRKLGFRILHDAGGRVAASFGLNREVPADLRGLYRGLGVDLAKFNGDGAWAMPLPARYLIDPDHTIAYAEINASEARRLDPAGLLTSLHGLRRRSVRH